MEPFVTLVATAVPLDATNIDTDQIIPARFLKVPRAADYGLYLFHDLRRRADGSQRPDFALNNPAYGGASILVANANFGCGSSREGAVYALKGAGFRSVIAPSFNDIFYTNALRNGLLPVRLPGPDVAALRHLVAETPAAQLGIDLPHQTVSGPGMPPMRFSVDPFGKACLLSGTDDIGFTAGYRDQIDAFAARYLAERPWLAGR